MLPWLSRSSIAASREPAVRVGRCEACGPKGSAVHGCVHVSGVERAAKGMGTAHVDVQLRVMQERARFSHARPG